MTPSSRLFADLSDYQPRFDPWAYASAGHLLVMLKATEGENETERHYDERAERAHAAGLVVAHYHFAHPDLHRFPEAEAAHFWQTVRPHFRDGDYLVLDLERLKFNNPAATNQWVGTFDALIFSHAGHELILYTYDALLRELGTGLQVRSKRFHVANYGGHVALLGAHRRRWAIQYTDGEFGSGPHTFAGIGRCDGSILNRRSTRRLLDLRWRRRKHR